MEGVSFSVLQSHGKDSGEAGVDNLALGRWDVVGNPDEANEVLHEVVNGVGGEWVAIPGLADAANIDDVLGARL